MTYSLRAIPVAGGELAVGCWEPDGPARATVLAVHGITASHLAFELLAHSLADVRVIAPDLRGRGGSRDLPGPWGMRRHADDLAAVLDALSIDSVTVVGHSMGAFAAVMLAHRHPMRVDGLVLVDGGLPLPSVTLEAGEDAVLRLLGPAAQRLSASFPDAEAYRRFWMAHPALAESWSPSIERYVDYDLVGEGPELRSACSVEAAAADALELNGDPDYLPALQAVAGPNAFLRAPRGLLDQPGGLYPSDAVAAWRREVPQLVVSEIDDVNHYTILMTPRGAAAVAAIVNTTIPTPKAKEPA